MSFINKKRLKNIEYILPIIVLVISLFGVFCILMATASPFTGEELTFEEITANLNLSKVRMQLIWMVIGFVCMFVVMLVSYKLYAKIWYAVAGVAAGAAGYGYSFWFGARRDKRLACNFRGS